ncbi:Dabb family protein [Algoriphagus pacificus]|uniref:Dabb family protein n=1 Tax=Algoriphagus pacificus TaxID=2811234 RepID=A0ABS3CLJ6_9BACT|nr:Dabb family protein [Algoriphagus pacificus]MBN7817376.1 Dabb family protein [Algoriphagus pacificus]
MKKMYKGILMLGLLAFFSACNEEKEEKNIIEEVKEIEMDKTMEPDSVLRHVVMFGFKETTSPEKIQEVVDAFKALPSKIEQIKGFEYGTNNSPEGLNDGLTHAFTLTFHSEEDRAIYLPHPDHKAFGEVLGNSLEKVVVVDYWTH